MSALSEDSRLDGLPVAFWLRQPHEPLDYNQHGGRPRAFGSSPRVTLVVSARCYAEATAHSPTGATGQPSGERPCARHLGSVHL
jgi:hypothetical protein